MFSPLLWFGGAQALIQKPTQSAMGKGAYLPVAKPDAGLQSQQAIFLSDVN
jgi:hypothetical protein